MAWPPTTEAYVMPIMRALPRLDDPQAQPCTLRMLLTAMPVNRAVHGRSEMRNDRMAAATMNAPMVARELPRVSCSRANTIFAGIFVFSRAAVMPNDARMKKITLLMNPPHTPMVVAPVAGSVAFRKGRMPNAGRLTMMTRPETATGTGSVTHRKMPATMRESAIFPSNDRPSGAGRSQPARIMIRAMPRQVRRLASDGPCGAGQVFSIADRSPSPRLAMKRLGRLPASDSSSLAILGKRLLNGRRTRIAHAERSVPAGIEK